MPCINNWVAARACSVRTSAAVHSKRTTQPLCIRSGSVRRRSAAHFI